MITAFLLVIALSSSLEDTPPKFKAAYDTVEQCLHVAYALNFGSGTLDNPGSLAQDKFHFCAQVRFPT